MLTQDQLKQTNDITEKLEFINELIEALDPKESFSTFFGLVQKFNQMGNFSFSIEDDNCWYFQYAFPDMSASIQKT